MSTSILKMPRRSNPSATGTSRVLEPVAPDTPNVNFSADELDSLRRDDAMTSVMVAVILGCAFVVLLGLTIGVTVWTMIVTT